MAVINHHLLTISQMAGRLKMTADQIQGFKTASNWDVSEISAFEAVSFVDANSPV